MRAHVVALCAWEHDLWWERCDPGFERQHQALFDLLGVGRGDRGGRIEVRWTESQARAFQLLHVLPHELGHHHDRMTTRSRREAARGEPYAESYADRVLETVWDAYVRRFGSP